MHEPEEWRGLMVGGDGDRFGPGHPATNLELARDAAHAPGNNSVKGVHVLPCAE